MKRHTKGDSERAGALLVICKEEMRVELALNFRRTETIMCHTPTVILTSYLRATIIPSTRIVYAVPTYSCVHTAPEYGMGLTYDIDVDTLQVAITRLLLGCYHKDLNFV